MDDPTFRLLTVGEISAYMEDMVKGGGFAAFKVEADGDGVVQRVRIRMRLRDAGNEVRRKLTAGVVAGTLLRHGSPDVEVCVGNKPLWMRS